MEKKTPISGKATVAPASKKPASLPQSTGMRKSVPTSGRTLLPKKLSTGTMRSSAGVTQGTDGAKNVNPVYKAANAAVKYAGNVAKEYKEWQQDKNSSANVGQFYGALLQGRRYDSKGKQK